MVDSCTLTVDGEGGASTGRGPDMVERTTIALARLPLEFDGMTVAVVADLHGGTRHGGSAAVREVVWTTNRLRADIVALLGDLVHGAARAGPYLSLLSELEASEGVWACLGNHEHGFVWHSRYLGPSATLSVGEWRRLYADAGIQLLTNEARPLARGVSRIWLLGVGDAYSGHDDLSAALAQTRVGELCLALTHSPDLIDDPRIGEVDLVLAGHTHGGQLRLPFVGPLFAPCRRFRERASGLVHANGTTMYVTRGAGEGLPARINCPREISLITLVCERGLPEREGNHVRDSHGQGQCLR
jgi:predicted MPP superfamily phosphohydrolase